MRSLLCPRKLIISYPFTVTRAFHILVVCCSWLLFADSVLRSLIYIGRHQNFSYFNRQYSVLCMLRPTCEGSKFPRLSSCGSGDTAKWEIYARFISSFPTLLLHMRKQLTSCLFFWMFKHSLSLFRRQIVLFLHLS